jgi:NAD/FAD-utilizing enzyme apparently involved in cell division
VEQVEIACKYSGYIARQEREIARMQKMEHRRIPPDFDYASLPGLRNESRQVLMGTELEFVIMVIAVSCVKLLSAHNSTQHTSRKHKV